LKQPRSVVSKYLDFIHLSHVWFVFDCWNMSLWEKTTCICF